MDGGAVAGGLVLRNIVIDRTVIRLELAQASGAPGGVIPVELHHREVAGGEGVELRGTEQLPAAAAAAIRAAIDKPLHGQLWVKAAPTQLGRPRQAAAHPNRKPGRAGVAGSGLDAAAEPTASSASTEDLTTAEPSPLGPVLLSLTIAALLVLTALLGVRAVKWTQANGRLRWQPMALLGLTVLALALRWALSPRTFLHEYYHISDMPSLLLDTFGYRGHGLTGPVLYAIVNACVGGEERAIFGTNAVLAALTIPAVVLFDLALFARWPRALLAGLFVCLLPLHLRFSACEELWIPGMLFAFWSLGAWLHYLANGSRLALAVATCALALSMQSRSELLVLPIAHAALFLVLRPPALWKQGLARPSMLAAAALLLALLSTRLHALRLLWSGTPKQSLPDLELLLQATVLLDRDVSAPSLLALLVLGGLYGLRRWPGRYAWLLGLCAAYVLIPLSAFSNRPCIYRTQMFSVLLAAIAGAGAFDLLCGLGRRRFVLPLAWGLCALVAVEGLRSHARFVTERFDQQLEFAFLEGTVPRLPPKATLITLTDQSAGRFHAFPDFLLDRNDKRFELYDLEGPDIGDLKSEPGRPLLFYQGMYCYYARKREPVDPMHQRCAAIRARFAMRPLMVQTLHARGYSQLYYARGGQGPYDVGFFEITGPRTPGPGGP